MTKKKPGRKRSGNTRLHLSFTPAALKALREFARLYGYPISAAASVLIVRGTAT